MDEETTVITAPLILIVDDHDLNRELLEGLLTLGRYRIVEANSGKRALEIAAQYNPEAILLDVRMPDMDGYEVCRRLQANARTYAIPVIMVSAADSVDDVAEALNAGADDFISRDKLGNELLTRLDTLIRRRRR